MAKTKFDIIINLQPTRSPDLNLDMSVFNKLEKMFYKAEDTDKELFPFNKNIETWKIEVIYVDPSCIQGKISMKTIDQQIIIPINRTGQKGDPTDTLECEFIIDKSPQKGRSPFFHFWNCGNNMSIKHKVFVDKQFPEIREQIILKLRQKEFLENRQPGLPLENHKGIVCK